MKPIDKLKEILCTALSVEKDVEELRFGCEFSALGAKQRFTELDQGCIYINRGGELVYDTDEYGEVHCKILGNPLSLKHLLMYYNEKVTDSELKIISSGDLYMVNGWDDEAFITTLDITKDHLYEQADEVITSIINFLKQ